jgi:hypothetical protein
MWTDSFCFLYMMLCSTFLSPLRTYVLLILIFPTDHAQGLSVLIDAHFQGSFCFADIPSATFTRNTANL